MDKSFMKKCIAEAIGTMFLMLIGVGAAIVLTYANLLNPVGFTAAVALAFGLGIVALAYSIGNISGGHVNPAVSLAMWIDKRITTKELIGYVIAQVIGALVGSLILYIIFINVDGGQTAFGANSINTTMLGEGFGGQILGLLVEIVLTFVFVSAILGVTSKSENSSIAGIVIGLVLVGVHLVGINLTGTSVNPARSLAPAIFASFVGNTVPLAQIWIFIIGPLIGGALAAIVYKYLFKK